MEKEKERVAPGITAYREPLGVRILTLYGLDDKGGTTLVDAGIPGSVTAWLDSGEINIPIQRVIITHADADHMGDASPVRLRFPEAVIMCHQADRRWIEDHSTILDERYGFSQERYGMGYPDEVMHALNDLCGPDIKIDETIADGDRLAIGDRQWEVLHVPGHSPGHISLWSPEDGILILGDAVLGFGPPAAASGRPSMPATHHVLADYFETINRLEALPVTLALTAHWRPMDSQGFKSLLQASRAQVDRDMAFVLEECRDRPQTFNELLQGINERFREWDPGEDLNYMFALDGAIQHLLALGSLKQEGTAFRAVASTT